MGLGSDRRPYHVGEGYVDLWLRVQPGARCDEWKWESERGVIVRLRAKPMKGEANEALVRFLAKRLKVAKSCVQIVAGQRSREKRVRVEGSPERILAVLGHDLGATLITGKAQ